MKYYKRLKIWKSSNVTFNPETCEAHSYKWWLFVAKVKNKVVFNNYRYSVSTEKHQSKVEWLLAQLGVKIDFYAEFPRGIDRPQSAIDLYKNRIESLQELIDTPRSHEKKNLERKSEQESLKIKIKEIQKLFKL